MRVYVCDHDTAPPGQVLKLHLSCNSLYVVDIYLISLFLSVLHELWEIKCPYSCSLILVFWVVSYLSFFTWCLQFCEANVHIPMENLHHMELLTKSQLCFSGHACELPHPDFLNVIVTYAYVLSLLLTFGQYG